MFESRHGTLGVKLMQKHRYCKSDDCGPAASSSPHFLQSTALISNTIDAHRIGKSGVEIIKKLTICTTVQITPSVERCLSDATRGTFLFLNFFCKL